MLDYRRLMTEFDPLIHYTLGAFGFSQTHAYYDDYAQELRIHLMTLADQFDGSPFGEERYMFTAYAKRRLRWYLSNYLRDSQDRLRPLSYEEVTQTAELVATQQDPGHHLDRLMLQARRELTPDLYQLLELLTYGDLTDQELADHLGVSRMTIHRRKRQLRAFFDRWREDQVHSSSH